MARRSKLGLHRSEMTGDVLVDFEARFMAEPMSGCWLWIGDCTVRGYGRFNGQLAHRASYELFVGRIPEGLVIDHKCRTLCCVNPDHLEPVTQAENVRRGRASENRKETCEKHGLKFEQRNGKGQRICLECSREISRRYRGEAKAMSFMPDAPVEPWWLAEDDDSAAQCMKSTINTIRMAQAVMRSNDLRHMRAFRNLALAGMGITSFARQAEGSTPLSLNVIRNMINAVTSKISKHRPKGTFQTFGAGYKSRKKSRDLEQFGEGMLYKERFRETAPKIFKNIATLGTGFSKVCAVGGGRICMENVFSPEITIDSAEGMHGNPRNWYQSKYVDKRWLAHQPHVKADPVLQERVMGLQSEYAHFDEAERELFSFTHDQDMVRLDEGYHLSSDDKEKDGWFCQSVQGVPLVMKHMKWDFAPAALARWREGSLGFWCMGLAEELVGIQVEINRIVRKIQTSFQLLANPYVLADRASNIARSSITDIPGSVILYNGREPRVYAPSTVSPEVFSHLDRLYQRAYELAGISQLSAQSQKPVGF